MDGSIRAQTASRAPRDPLRFWCVDAEMRSSCCSQNRILCKCWPVKPAEGACLFLWSVPNLPVWGPVCRPTSEIVLQPILRVLWDLRARIHNGGSQPQTVSLPTAAWKDTSFRRPFLSASATWREKHVQKRESCGDPLGKIISLDHVARLKLAYWKKLRENM